MRFPGQIRAAIAAHADFCHPEEACGLLAVDRAGEIRFAYCMTNVDASATRYTVDPEEHFRAMRHAEANGWEIGGVFHSHPDSEPYPSATDLALAGDPDWLYVVAGPAGPGGRRMRAFRIRDRTADEVDLD